MRTQYCYYEHMLKTESAARQESQSNAS